MQQIAKLTLKISNNFKIQNISYIDQKGMIVNIEYNGELYEMKVFNNIENSLISAGKKSEREAVAILAFLLTNDKINAYEINGKSVDFDEFNRNLINTELRNKIPVFQLDSLIKDLKGWQVFDEIAHDNYVSKLEYRKLRESMSPQKR